jgi:hypothetical protein
MTEETIVTTWGDTGDETFLALAKGGGDSPLRIMVLGEPEEVVEDLARAFFERRWDLVAVDDLESAGDVIDKVSLSAVVLPLELGDVMYRRLLEVALDRRPIKYVPLIAYTDKVDSDRARAWIAGCDGFVSYSGGSAALCREVAALLVIARDTERLLSRVVFTDVR